MRNGSEPSLSTRGLGARVLVAALAASAGAHAGLVPTHLNGERRLAAAFLMAVMLLAAAAAAGTSANAAAFHDAMRVLWEAHGAWTMVIVSFAGNLPNLKAEEQVLLQHQVDIGNAVKPYYGKPGGNKLTKLLKSHILGALNVLVAARPGDEMRLSQAEANWFANGRQIADFLHAPDPRFLSRSAARQMMNTHLNQVIQQGVDELKGNYAADARAFAPYIRHILDMADMISGGIVQQFPSRFR